MLEKSDSYSMQRTSWKKEMLSIWYQGKDFKKKKKNVISVQKQQQLKGDLLRMGLLRAGER